MLISSIGKDAALSRRKDEFDSRSEYHIQAQEDNIVAILLSVAIGEIGLTVEA